MAAGEPEHGSCRQLDASARRQADAGANREAYGEGIGPHAHFSAVASQAARDTSEAMKKHIAKKKKAAGKKRAARKDPAQNALSIVERVTGGKLKE